MTDSPAPGRVYTIVSRSHVNKWDDALGVVTPGWELKVNWTSTGTIIPVFVPDRYYTAANVDSLIRNAGAADEQVHALGA